MALTRRFPRERRRETLPIVNRFLRIGPVRDALRGIPAQPRKHYAKALADELRWEKRYRRWKAHDPDASSGGPTTLQIRRAVELLRGERWGVSAETAEDYDQARLALERILEDHPETWDVDRKIYLVDPSLSEQLERLHARHPYLREMINDRAYKMLQREHREILRRASRLEREMEEGNSPLHEKLRRSTHEWRQRGAISTAPSVTFYTTWSEIRSRDGARGR
jgi:hypothetical protein